MRKFAISVPLKRAEVGAVLNESKMSKPEPSAPPPGKFCALSADACTVGLVNPLLPVNGVIVRLLGGMVELTLNATAEKNSLEVERLEVSDRWTVPGATVEKIAVK